MNKARLEAFSDGVFAIVITLLILNIRLPEVSYEHLPEALNSLWPSISAYVMSFIVIGLYWISHHNSFLLVTQTSRVFLWMNIVLLLWVSFIPFPTYLMGKYPMKEIPLLIYGGNLIAANLTGLGMLWYAQRHPEMCSPVFTRSIFRNQLRVYGLVNGCYLLAMVLSFFCPLASYLIYAAVLGLLIFLYGVRNYH